MKNILLIDADSTIPNIAIMKLSEFHKSMGNQVDFVKLNMPYYPNKKKKLFYVPTGYDKVFCSVVFEGNASFIKGDTIIFGGSGCDLSVTLTDEIENSPLDYSLYPENDTSYGFITRGCIRKCYFCKVPQKEGMIRRVSNIDSIVNPKYKKTKFLDNNILALPEHYEILKELVQKKIKCNFCQGLDIRLITRENSELLSQLNYFGDYMFAFDDINSMSLIEKKLELLYWRRDWNFKFFVYVHPEMLIKDTVTRIEWLKDRKILPYFMRDISCWGSQYREFYIDMAAYCNQPNLVRKMDFETFLRKRHIKHTNRELRIEKSLQAYRS